MGKQKETPINSRRLVVLMAAGYYSAFIVLGMINASLGPTLPGLAAKTCSSLSAISYLFTARYLGYLIGAMRGGRLYDQVPRGGNRLMLTTLIALAALLALIPLIPAIWSLVVVMFLVGLFLGVLDVGGNTLIFWVDRGNANPLLNGLHLFSGVGAFLMPIVLASRHFRDANTIYSYWLIAGVILVVALVLYVIPCPSVEGKENGVPANGGGAFLVTLVALLYFCYAGLEAGFGGWIYSYALGHSEFDGVEAALLNSAFWGAFTLSRLLIIPVSRYLRPMTIVSLSLSGAALGIAAILLIPGACLLWMGTCVFGFAVGALFPSLLSFAASKYPVNGQTTGFFLMGNAVGGMSLPLLIGQLMGVYGMRVMPYFIAGDLALAIALFGLARLLPVDTMRSGRMRKPIVT